MSKQYLKGQNVRVFYGVEDPAVVACATNCSIDYTANTEESGTKDDEGLVNDKEVTSVSGTITSDALVLVGGQEVIKAALQLVGKKVKVECNLTEGAQNREKAECLFRAEAIVDSVNLSAQNKQNVTYSVKMSFTKEPDFDPVPGE